MTQPLRFGISTLQQVPWPTLVERWQQAETLGFDSAWMPDHLVHPRQPGGPWLEAWTLLAGLAARTERIRIGIMVTNVLFRNPLLLLKEAVTVDQISGGRLELALGSGNSGASQAAAGIDPGDALEREQRLAEVVEIADRLLHGEEVTDRTRFYDLVGAVLRPGPAQQPRPRLTISGRRPATLRLAARYADAWNMFVWPFGLPAQAAMEQARAASERLSEYADGLGRAPDEVGRSVVVGVAQDPLWASVEAFHDFIGRYREIGFNEFIFLAPPEEFGPPGAVQPGIFERVACEVLPSLRTSTPA
jgi:alkanesulfonate monooxygenase SsuD/methylene tetrahydromethanopterin reductase-like flavin-dependent oxidoreductase (luciferase family)